MAQFRKKPVVIEAVRLTEQTVISTLEGDMTGNIGDWLITGVNGEAYPCKDDIFRKTYEPVDVVETLVQEALEKQITRQNMSYRGGKA